MTRHPNDPLFVAHCTECGGDPDVCGGGPLQGGQCGVAKPTAEPMYCKRCESIDYFEHCIYCDQPTEEYSTFIDKARSAREEY